LSSFGPAAIASVYRDVILRSYRNVIVFCYRNKFGFQLNDDNALKAVLRIFWQATLAMLSTISTHTTRLSIVFDYSANDARAFAIADDKQDRRSESRATRQAESVNLIS
jgi:hypothetical protein